MEYLELLPLIGTFALIASTFAMIRMFIFPPRLELEEIEFDLRAGKLQDDVARDAARYAQAKILAQQRYSLKFKKPDNRAKAILNFFRS